MLIYETREIQGVHNKVGDAVKVIRQLGEEFIGGEKNENYMRVSVWEDRKITGFENRVQKQN